MLSLPIKLYNSAEQLTGKKFLVTTAGFFLVSLLVGLAIGYIITPVLTEDELLVEPDSMAEPLETRAVFTGRVVKLPEINQVDGITHVLTDLSGNDIILLRTNDHKLDIVENLFVQVRGRVTQDSQGKDVLNIAEVIISTNESN